jgi:alkylphosphonate utilization operon protein PhnA
MTKIEIKHKFKFLRSELFDAFLNIEIAKHFMFRTDAGQLMNAQLVPELGGEFVFEEQRLDENKNTVVERHFGSFVEIDKPERLTFVFSVSQQTDQSDYVELAFQEINSGCEITLSHDINPDFLKNKKKIENSWTQMLEKLDIYLSNLKMHALAGAAVIPKDSLGQNLSEGDSVRTIKDLNVKGSSMVIKRGTIVKKVHLISGNDEEVDCKVDGVALSLETQWLVKI